MKSQCSHFLKVVSQLTMENSDSQPKMRRTKKKSLSKQIDFFLLYKHYQKYESEDPLAFPKSKGEHWPGPFAAPPPKPEKSALWTRLMGSHRLFYFFAVIATFSVH